MSATGFVDITKALKLLLTQAPALAGGNVERGRFRPLQQGQAAAIVIAPAVAVRQPGATSGPQHWLTTVVLELQVRAAAGEAGEDAMDALLALVYARLPQLAALVPNVSDPLADVRIEWEPSEADTPLIAARLIFNVQHRTAEAVLAAG